MTHCRAGYRFACVSVLVALLLLACDGENRSRSPVPTPDAGHPPSDDLAEFDMLCAAAEQLWQKWLTGGCLTVPWQQHLDHTSTEYQDGKGNSYYYFPDSGPQCARAHAALVAGRFTLSSDALGRCKSLLAERLRNCVAPELSACNMLHGAVPAGEPCYAQEILGVESCADGATCPSCDSYLECPSCPATCQPIPAPGAVGAPCDGSCNPGLVCEGNACIDPCAKCAPGQDCRVIQDDMNSYFSTCGTGPGAFCGEAAWNCDPGLECAWGDYGGFDWGELCQVIAIAEGGDCTMYPARCTKDLFCKAGICARLELDEACSRNNQCKSGRCAAGHCAGPGSLGESCAPGDDGDSMAPCHARLGCGLCVGCTGPTCRELGVLTKDAACAEDPECGKNLSCDTSRHTCQPVATEGQACPGAVQCSRGLTCSHPDGKECRDASDGCSCRKSDSVGTSCICTHDDCWQPCDSSLVCRSNPYGHGPLTFCLPPARSGDACASDLDCADRTTETDLGTPLSKLYCDSVHTHTCRMRLGVGESCVSSECAAGLGCILRHDGLKHCADGWGAMKESPWCYPGGPTDK